MQVPSSPTNGAIPIRPSVDPKFLLMAAAGMEHQAQSAYKPGATFSDSELSKNFEDRRGFGAMENLGLEIESMLTVSKARQNKQGNTDGDIFNHTETPSDTGLLERAMTASPRDISSMKRVTTMTRR